MSNILAKTTQQQFEGLGRLGWSLRSRSICGSRNADGLGFDLRPQPRRQLLQRDDVDATPEQRFEVIAEVEERGQRYPDRIELHHQIDVARFSRATEPNS